MRRIGITGGIGSGKSTVLAILERDYDAVIVQADQIGRELMEPGAACYNAVIDLFGPECVTGDGSLDRSYIAGRIYADERLRNAQNAIIHPAVRTEIMRRMEACRSAGHDWFFVEAALLIEGGYESVCDELWYIYAEESVRVHRLMRDRMMTEESVRAVMRNQLDEATFRAHCAFVIDNSGTEAQTARQIKERMEKYEG